MTQSPFDKDFDWLSDDFVKMSQNKKYKKRPNAVSDISQGNLMLDGKIWIADDDDELKMKLLVIARGTAGHRGRESTKSMLQERYRWRNMSEDCTDFLKHCFHCLSANGDLKMPRPLPLTLHGTKPNEVLHFDFPFLGPTTKGLKYVLVLKDDYLDTFGYVRLRVQTQSVQQGK